MSKTLKVGDSVVVFGSRNATVVDVSTNGKSVQVTGDYSGWTNTSNVRPSTGLRLTVTPFGKQVSGR